MEKLPNEGTTKPCPFSMMVDALEPGDTFNFHKPCTLTFYGKTDTEDGPMLNFEISDLKYEDDEE